MMENINEFVKNFRERLSSPFFFSFIVSWIVANWKVTIALLWYNSELYPKEGDLIRFVESNTSNWQSIILPLISAALYTGLVRNLVSAFVVFGVRWGGDWNLNISKTSKIPVSKFLTYRDLYIKTNKELEKIIGDERKTIEEADKQRQRNNELEASNLALQGDILKLNGILDEIQSNLTATTNESVHYKSEYEKIVEKVGANQSLLESYRNQRFLDGTWIFRYDNAMRNIHLEETYYIADGIVHIINGKRMESLYKIIYFFHDVVNKKLLLILKFIPETEEMNFINNINSKIQTFEARNDREFITYVRTKYEPVLIHDLSVESGRILKGIENVQGLISYSKSI